MNYVQMLRRDHIEERNGFKFIRLKSGRLLSFLDVLGMAKGAHTALGTALARCLKLVTDDPEMGDDDLERIEWFLDNLELHVGSVREEVAKRRGIKTKEERIALLRNTTGRTPEEAAEFQRKADELERRIEAAAFEEER